MQIRLIDGGCDLMDATWSAIVHGVSRGFLGNSAKRYVAFNLDRMQRRYHGIVGKAATKRAASKNAAEQQPGEKTLPLPPRSPSPHLATLADQQDEDADAPYRD
ncbi:MAG: hypothetical protein GY847_13345 [Proteobacteria bacterium]|nr:hypothetical protein [Pseudomonadota bacterium]